MKRNKSAWKLEKETVELWNKEAKERYKGWIEFTKGFPDKMYFNPKTQKLVLVELKRGKHGFHKHKKQLMKVILESKEREALLVRHKPETGILLVADAMKEKTKG